MRATKIESVQVLRAVAALSIAILHVLHEAIPLDPSGYVERWHDALPWAAGVDLFFVISGFVMVYASTELFGRRGSPATFMARRLIRIVPLYWLTTTLFLVVAVAAPSSVSQGGFGITDVVMSYAFMPVSRPDGSIQPIYSLGWTLNYEMYFYVVFAACIMLPRRHALAAVSLLLGIAMAVHRLVPPRATALVFWTDGMLLEFLLGMAVAVIATREVRLAKPFRIGLILTALTLVVAGDHSGFSGRALITGVPMSLLLAATVLGRSARMPRALLLLGDASYALYLIHPFAMRPVGFVWQRLHLTGPVAAVLYAGAALLLAVMAAICVHLWFERPIDAWLRLRLANRSRRRTPLPHAAA